MIGSNSIKLKRVLRLLAILFAGSASVSCVKRIAWTEAERDQATKILCPEVKKDLAQCESDLKYSSADIDELMRELEICRQSK